ncbi:YciI family protein [Portibacter marinus]|uniref:YciI family protein n=1 Tax=Portibacter marinus TaxID=2898660 RepID=UPI001F3BE526|nr:YciI family protein [Portibacter marinus]
MVVSQESNPNYDSALAEKLGADDYGMKTYVFVLLKSGENKSEDQDARSAAFAGHMKNINHLVKEEKLLVAGPMLKNDKDYRGIFILNVNSIEEAEELMLTDPAIAAGYLYPDMTLWYGSAALGEYLEASDKVWKINP